MNFYIDYWDIIYNGIDDVNNYQFLENYFIREFRKAEKDHYPAGEFFTGCMREIINLQNSFEIKKQKRKEQIISDIEKAKAGTLQPFLLSDNETIEQYHKNFIEQSLIELKEESFLVTVNIPNSIGAYCSIDFDEIQYIKESLEKAFDKVNEKKPENQKAISEEFKTFEDLFHDNYKNLVGPFIEILKEVEPPIIDLEFNWIADNKGSILIWIDEMKIQGIIKKASRAVYAKLLQEKIKGFSIDPSMLSKSKFKKRSEEYYRKQLKTLISITKLKNPQK